MLNYINVDELPSWKFITSQTLVFSKPRSRMRSTLALLLPFAFAAPAPVVERAVKPVYWLLAGDSTTAPAGGWGDAFLQKTVASGSSGHNYGHSGATTKSFRAGSDWSKVIKDIGTYKSDHRVYVTIQVM